jgi:hypothetical protein
MATIISGERRRWMPTRVSGPTPQPSSLAASPSTRATSSPYRIVLNAVRNATVWGHLAAVARIASMTVCCSSPIMSGPQSRWDERRLPSGRSALVTASRSCASRVWRHLPEIGQVPGSHSTEISSALGYCRHESAELSCGTSGCARSSWSTCLSVPAADDSGKQSVVMGQTHENVPDLDPSPCFVAIGHPNRSRFL